MAMRFTLGSGEGPLGTAQERRSIIQHLALIVSSKNIEQVVLLNGEELEGKYFKLYRNLMKLKKADTYSYNQYWQAIDDALAGAKKVYLSPDGVFNQISINSLQTGDGQYVLDKREYVNITSLRNLESLAIKRQSEKTSQKTAILFGNPQYGSTDIDPLPGTGKEVDAINGILQNFGYKTQEAQGIDASEHMIKTAAHKGILHVATHGFFVADPKQGQNSVFSVPLYNINENVLLRSGLLLAVPDSNKLIQVICQSLTMAF